MQKKTMIPRKDHSFVLGKQESTLTYYFEADLELFMSKSELKKFDKWIRGQTCALIDGKMVFYSWDVERFLKLVREKIPTFFD